MHDLEIMKRLNREAVERFNRCQGERKGYGAKYCKHWPKCTHDDCENCSVTIKQPSDSVVWSTLIPIAYNDKRRVPNSVANALLTRVGHVFGGYTLDAPSSGVWYDDDGKQYDDTTQRLTVACKRSQLGDARGIVKLIGIATGQKCILFFVDGAAEFLYLDSQEDNQCITKPENVISVPGPESAPAHNFPGVPTGYVPYGWSTIGG